MPTTEGVENIAVVESFLAALEAQDADRALDYLAEDVVYQNVPFPPDRGKAAVARTLRGFAKLATGFEVRMHHIAERDGVVLTERTDVITGPLLYLDIWVCGTFEVRDGKITLWRDYFDLGQLGLRLATSPFRWLTKRSK